MGTKLRRWQKEAFPQWWKARRGIIKVVTGGGKTFFAIHCIEKYLKKFPYNNVLIVVPSVPLLDQWSVDMHSIYSSGLSLNGGGYKIDEISKINITTINSLKNIHHKFDTSKTFLIIDECHKIGTEKNFNMLNKKFNSSLGLSATPERDFDNNFEDMIVPILGPVVYSYDYIQGYKDGIISDFNLINAYAPLLESEDEDHKELTKKINKRISILGGFDTTDNALKILLFERARIVNNASNRIPLGVKLMQNNQRKKWIVFSESKKQASIFNEFINKYGYRSAIYNTDLSMNIRKRNLREFKENMLDVIVTCKSLDEGFDYPEIDAALILSASTTNRQRIQRIGRALRKSTNKKNALIISLYSSDSEYERLKDESLKFSKEGIRINWTKLNY